MKTDFYVSLDIFVNVIILQFFSRLQTGEAFVMNTKIVNNPRMATSKVIYSFADLALFDNLFTALSLYKVC